MNVIYEYLSNNSKTIDMNVGHKWRWIFLVKSSEYFYFMNFIRIAKQRK